MGGDDPRVFWDMTPRELDAFVRGRSEGATDVHASRIAQAWHVASFLFRRMPGKNKLPSLERIIRAVTGRKPREQTVEEQLKLVKALNARFGGTVRKMGKGA